MRVLLLSDVYFPRVNGVSTSIATFRADLAAVGVETTLVAPQYESDPEEADDSGIIRVPSSRVPMDPEDRLMHWRALQSALRGLRQAFLAGACPHAVCGSLRRRAICACAGIPVVETYHTHFEEYLHHYIPFLPRVLGRRLARTITRSQCNQVRCDSGPVRADARDIGGLRGAHAGRSDTDRPRPLRFRARRRRALPQPARHFPGRGPWCCTLGRVAHEKNIGFLIDSFLEVRRARPEPCW